MKILEIMGLLGLGLLSGASKVGIPGALIFSPLMATAYGGIKSSGIIIIPMLLSDLIILYYYGKRVDKKLLIKLLPITCLGVFVATIFGSYISDEIFKKSIGIIILIIGVLSFLKSLHFDFSKLSMIFGFLGGFTSFIGSVSGPLMSIYFLNIKTDNHKNLDREEFLGTRSWFYFIVNILKFILYFFILKSVTLETTKLGFISCITLWPGVIIGKLFIDRLEQETFEKFIIIVSLISGVKLIFS